jgi:hypothetical protein
MRDLSSGEGQRIQLTHTTRSKHIHRDPISWTLCKEQARQEQPAFEHVTSSNRRPKKSNDLTRNRYMTWKSVPRFETDSTFAWILNDASKSSWKNKHITTPHFSERLALYSQLSDGRSPAIVITESLQSAMWGRIDSIQNDHNSHYLNGWPNGSWSLVKRYLKPGGTNTAIMELWHSLINNNGPGDLDIYKIM